MLLFFFSPAGTMFSPLKRKESQYFQKFYLNVFFLFTVWLGLQANKVSLLIFVSLKTVSYQDFIIFCFSCRITLMCCTLARLAPNISTDELHSGSLLTFDSSEYYHRDVEYSSLHRIYLNPPVAESWSMFGHDWAKGFFV